ncbi:MULTISPECIES: molybdate ABC transporter permease subunit [Falsihalocynthiibacter]|uniref:molybdate ABC transporter permease subunit n=1 Tax=Falsihalocynthiibacter TaxID=2854182 RepID=UPI0030012957
MLSLTRWFSKIIGIQLALLMFAPSALADKITVAVASNFASAFEVIAQDFEAKSGHKVETATGSTGKIFAQIQQGAPFDLFLAADQDRPRALVAGNPAYERASYAQGQLTIVSRVNAPPLAEARIGIADPATAPYGAAALRTLKTLGFEPAALNIVNGQNVANVASYLHSGNIDIGFLAASQHFPNARFTTEIVRDIRLTQDMVLLSQTPAAIALFAYMQSDSVRTALPDLGYLAPNGEETYIEPVEHSSVTLWPSIRLSLLLASATTLILLAIGIPIAWWLTITQSRMRPVVETITALPLVVPPTVLGFYLLVMFAPTTPIGRLWITLTGDTLTFSFAGLLVASVLYSLPFAVQPLHTGFQAIGRGTIEAAQTMGASRMSLFLRVILPLSRRGVLTATVLSFAHTIGEFGVVLMVGGNLPGKTRVISIEIFNRVEVLDYRAAHVLAGGLLVFSFLALFLIYSLNGRAARSGIAGENHD